MTEGTLPPHFGVGTSTDLVRFDVPILYGIPFRQKIRAQCRQVIDTNLQESHSHPP